MSIDDATTIAIPVGLSPNIGNGFFAFGIKHLLEKAIPNSRVVTLADQAAYLNLLPGRGYRHEPKNSLRYLEHVRPDYIVLSGSLLTDQFPRIWEDALRALTEAGTKILLIGVGYYDYSPEERKVCSDLLEKFPPYVFISRDRQTYEDLNGIAEHSHDGIDGAYFIPDVFQPIPTDLPKYVVMNFDRTPEPRVAILGDDSPRSSGFLRETSDFDFDDRMWQAQFPKLRFIASRRLGKGFAFLLGPLGLHGTTQASVDDYMIVRTDHALNPLMIRRIFRGPNAFAGDVVNSYLNIYAHSRLTLTDRIHAALVTMAYGGTARLYTRSGRASIIERLGGGEVTSEPTRLDLDRVAAEKQSALDFLSAIPF